LHNFFRTLSLSKIFWRRNYQEKQLKYTFFFITVLLIFFNSVCTAEDILKMSTTTSTENSGLLATLNPAFEKKFNVKLHVIAVGTGKALKIGANGDVDVVFVHAPDAELKYVEQGYFIDRSEVMHNDFVIVGPTNDPAEAKTADSALSAFRKIASHHAVFISRGDDSGTHKKEREIWKKTAINPQGNWYLSVGQGMGAVLRMADDKQAYALTDRGTQIAYSDKITIKVLFEGDPTLFNPYHIMAVSPEKHSHVRYDLAKKYIEFVTGKEGQSIIKNYRLGGQQLFYPDACGQTN